MPHTTVGSMVQEAAVFTGTRRWTSRWKPLFSGAFAGFCLVWCSLVPSSAAGPGTRSGISPSPCTVPGRVIRPYSSQGVTASEFSKQGGHIFAAALREARRLPNVQWVILHGSDNLEFSCWPRGTSEIEVEVGYNAKQGTSLLAASLTRGPLPRISSRVRRVPTPVKP